MLILLLLIMVELVRVLFFLAGLVLLAFVAMIAYWIFFEPKQTPPAQARERLLAELNADFNERKRR